MVWVAGAILPTTLIIATTRDTALSLSFRAHPGNALAACRRRRVLAGPLSLRRFECGGVRERSDAHDAVVVDRRAGPAPHGPRDVRRVGDRRCGGAFLALLGLVALVFAVCLFALKMLLLMVLAVLFVAGPCLSRSPRCRRSAISHGVGCSRWSGSA